MKVMNLCVIAIRFLLLEGVLNAADSRLTNMDAWGSVVQKASLKEIATKMTESNPAWPTIRSPFYISNRPVPERYEEEKALAIGNEFYRVLKEKVQLDRSVGLEEWKQQMVTLSVINGCLRIAGGYSNLLLADSVDRLQLLGAVDQIIANPRRVAEVKKAVEKYHASKGLNVHELLSALIDEDGLLVGKRSEINAVDGRKKLFEALLPIGVGMNEVMIAMQTKERSTSRLLKETSAVGLVVRAAETESLWNVHFAGLLAFLEKGGTFEELDANDVLPFETRMGGDIQLFTSNFFNIHRLSVEHLLGLRELCNNPSARSAFLEVVK